MIVDHGDEIGAKTYRPLAQLGCQNCVSDDDEHCSFVHLFAIMSCVRFQLLINPHGHGRWDHVWPILVLWIFRVGFLFIFVFLYELRDVFYASVVLWPVDMSKNTLFNYFSRSPASASKGASKMDGSTSSATPSKRQSSKQNSVTPKRTPKSVNGSAKKDKVSDSSSSKKPTDKRKPKKLGK